MKIKELEWKEEHDTSSADSIVGRFVVIKNTWSCLGRMKHFLEVRDHETAKEAAQAYYESLIRTTITE